MRRRVAAGGACATRKTRFRDKESAVRALREIRGRGDRRDKKPARAYECPLCNGWHLTSKEK